MEQIRELMQYLGENPLIGLGVAAVLIGIYFLLNRKTRLEREADKRFDELRKERGEQYRRTRPIR